MGIAVGSNLLCNSDILIIGMMMTNVDVALYSVPLKIIEYMQLILTSFSEVAYPAMSKYSNKNELTKTKEIFYKYSGTLTILSAPVIITMLFFAKFVILIMSGQQYASSGETISILQVFLISALFLPLDRFSGTLLDSMGLPKYNFIKVMSMVCVNVVGDFIAIVVFQSLELVAVITIVTTIVGLIISYKYIFIQMQINFIRIFPYGFEVCKNGIHEILKKNSVRARSLYEE
jgi:O-antigen/teichoic acid export membrane protein